MDKKKDRIERDSLGEIRVPADALFGAQTQRAVENFTISGLRMPRAFIQALGLIKQAAATVNKDLGLLDPTLADAVTAAAAEVKDGLHDRHFPIDVFQTGSGTSTNMNANEVIARLATRRLQDASRDERNLIDPNDHVNLGQSSNDVIPSAVHLSACMEIESRLLPALAHLASTIRKRADELDGVVKTGRTHLMDAMPVTLGQELGGWAAQIDSAVERISGSRARLTGLALGGTAVGTGINAHPKFAERVIARLGKETAIDFHAAPNRFESMSSQETAAEMSGQLRTLAVGLSKISNDLRWMNSGPLSGLGELTLRALQPGSSIMPGKVNPVAPEAVAMACAQIMGNDATIAIAAQSGNFQLNVMLPLIAHNLLQSIELAANSARLLADKAIADFTVKDARILRNLERNPVLVTALNPVIGYAKGAEIAKKAHAEGRPLLEVAMEMTDLSKKELKRLLDPARLTRGGIVSSRSEESGRES